jgi:hypothetical protein
VVAYEIDEFKFDPSAILDDHCVSGGVGAFGSNPLVCGGEQAVPLLMLRRGASQALPTARKGSFRNFRRML